MGLTWGLPTSPVHLHYICFHLLWFGLHKTYSQNKIFKGQNKSEIFIKWSGSVAQPIEVPNEDANADEASDDIVQDEASVVTDNSVSVALAEPEVSEPTEDVNEEQDNTKFKVGDVAMVQRKTLYWPCKILEVSNKQYKYMIYDKARTEETKNASVRDGYVDK